MGTLLGVAGTPTAYVEGLILPGMVGVRLRDCRPFSDCLQRLLNSSPSGVKTESRLWLPLLLLRQAALSYVVAKSAVV